MQTKLLSMLGLARRAGKLSMGNDPVLESLRKGESFLLLCAQDLSPRTRKGIAAQAGKVPLYRLPISMEEISFAIGKRSGILSINDRGFADKLAAYAIGLKGCEKIPSEKS